jgi:hypothetical protein
MRTWVAGIMIGVCLLVSSCKTPGQPSQPPKQLESDSIVKDKSFAEWCASEPNLAKAELERCRDELEIANSDREKGWK